MRSHLPLPPLTYCSMYQSKDKFALTDFTKSRFGDQIQLKRKRNERLLRKRCLIHLAPNQSSHLTWFCIICFSFRFVIFLPSPGSLICILSCYWSQFFFFFAENCQIWSVLQPGNPKRVSVNSLWQAYEVGLLGNYSEIT